MASPEDRATGPEGGACCVRHSVRAETPRQSKNTKGQAAFSGACEHQGLQTAAGLEVFAPCGNGLEEDVDKLLDVHDAGGVTDGFDQDAQAAGGVYLEGRCGNDGEGSTDASDRRCGISPDRAVGQ